MGSSHRRQVLAAGWTRSDADRMVRRREWVRLLPGVYLDHTGEPSWLQRAWAGVLYYWPAGLAGFSALRVTAGPGWQRHRDDGPIWVAVASDRHVHPRPGYDVRWLKEFDRQVLPQVHPPRMRFEDACIDAVGSTPARLDKIQLLAQAVQSRRTTAGRLLTTVSSHGRVSDRRWLVAVLHDIEAGTQSVLEHGYLAQVERPHGLPRGSRQLAGRDSSGRIYRDVVYDEYGQYVELDGRLFHDTAGARDADLERDLDVALTRRGTVRLGWGQVYGRPCVTAYKIGRLLAARGWTGAVIRCGPDCAAGA